MSDEQKRTPKHEEVRNSLPADLVSVFDDFVADYKFHATKRHGAPYVSYVVLADMVRAGWRLPDQSKQDPEPSQ